MPYLRFWRTATPAAVPPHLCMFATAATDAAHTDLVVPRHPTFGFAVPLPLRSACHAYRSCCFLHHYFIPGHAVVYHRFLGCYGLPAVSALNPFCHLGFCYFCTPVPTPAFHYLLPFPTATALHLPKTRVSLQFLNFAISCLDFWFLPVETTFTHTGIMDRDLNLYPHTTTCLTYYLPPFCILAFWTTTRFCSFLPYPPLDRTILKTGSYFYPTVPLPTTPTASYYTMIPFSVRLPPAILYTYLRTIYFVRSSPHTVPLHFYTHDITTVITTCIHYSYNTTIFLPPVHTCSNSTSALPGSAHTHRFLTYLAWSFCSPLCLMIFWTVHACRHTCYLLLPQRALVPLLCLR